MPDVQKIWYFAYGSNKDPTHLCTYLLKNAASPKLVKEIWGRRAFLDNCQVKYRDTLLKSVTSGKSNLEISSDGARVEGCLYSFPKQLVKWLDKKEGMLNSPRTYLPQNVEVRLPYSNLTVSGMTYVMSLDKPRQELKPSPEYLTWCSFRWPVEFTRLVDLCPRPANIINVAVPSTMDNKNWLIVVLGLWVIVCITSFLISWLRPRICDMQNVSLNILFRLQSCAKKYNVTYWAVYGTLLGAVREGSMIKWDDDIDVGMKTTDLAKIEPHLNEFGLRIVESLPVLGEIRHTKSYVKLVLLNRVNRKIGINDSVVNMCCSLDIFLFEDQGENVVCGYENTQVYAKTDIENLQPFPIGTRCENKILQKIDVPCPRNAHTYLEKTFGRNWPEPVRCKTHYELVTDYLIAALFMLALFFSIGVLVFTQLKKKTSAIKTTK